MCLNKVISLSLSFHSLSLSLSLSLSYTKKTDYNTYLCNMIKTNNISPCQYNV